MYIASIFLMKIKVTMGSVKKPKRALRRHLVDWPGCSLAKLGLTLKEEESLRNRIKGRMGAGTLERKLWNRRPDGRSRYYWRAESRETPLEGACGKNGEGLRCKTSVLRTNKRKPTSRTFEVPLERPRSETSWRTASGDIWCHKANLAFSRCGAVVRSLSN